jgi:hypothetical protein
MTEREKKALLTAVRQVAKVVKPPPPPPPKTPHPGESDQQKEGVKRGE